MLLQHLIRRMDSLSSLHFQDDGVHARNLSSISMTESGEHCSLSSEEILTFMIFENFEVITSLYLAL